MSRSIHKNEPIFYVYRHIRLDTGRPFYVGKGSGRGRHKNKTNRNLYWKRIVNKVGYTVEIIGKNLTEDEAFQKEILLIKLYKSLGMCEANLTYGGEGTKGLLKTEETKSKISKAHGGRDFFVIKDDKIIGVWSNMNKCSRDLNILKPHIYQILHKKANRRTSRGYSFKYCT